MRAHLQRHASHDNYPIPPYLNGVIGSRIGRTFSSFSFRPGLLLKAASPNTAESSLYSSLDHNPHSSLANHLSSLNKRLREYTGTRYGLSSKQLYHSRRLVSPTPDTPLRTLSAGIFGASGSGNTRSSLRRHRIYRGYAEKAFPVPLKQPPVEGDAKDKSFAWRLTLDPSKVKLGRIVRERHYLESKLAASSAKHAGFIFTRKSYGIEFEKRWNSLYPNSIIHLDWKKNFRLLYNSKYGGKSDMEIWNSLDLPSLDIVTTWAQHFKDLESGTSFWSGIINPVEKANMWPGIAIWLLLFSPRNILIFLESTYTWPYPPFRMISECFLYIQAFLSGELTSNSQFNHNYLDLLRRLLAPHAWPALSVSQSGIRIYLQHCEPKEFLNAFETVARRDVLATIDTLLYFMDQFNKSNDSRNSLRALQLIASQGITDIKFEDVAHRCTKLLTMDFVVDEAGTRSFKLLPEILNLGIRPERPMLNVVMQNACKLNDPDMAWDIFSSSPIPPDVYTYMILLNDATKRGDSKRIEDCYRLLASNSAIRQEPYVISKILHGLYTHLCSTKPGAELRAFNTMLHMYSSYHDPQPLKDLNIIQEEDAIVETGEVSPPSAHALTIMISAYLRLYRNTTRIMELYNRFCKLVREGHDSIGQLAETDHTYNDFLMALQPDVRMIAQSVSIVENMYSPLPKTAFLKTQNRPIIQCLPTIRTWNILLNTAINHGRMGIVRAICQTMRDHDVEMDVSIWNVILQGYAKLQMTDAVAITVKAMLQEGLIPDQYTFGSVYEIRDQSKLQKLLHGLGVDPEGLTMTNHRENTPCDELVEGADAKLQTTANEVRQLLRAFGDTAPHPDFPQEPLPETVRVLDEIVTDFIIETCHSAAQVAAHAGRQKVKVDDFMFVIRRDASKLGRVQELFQIEKELKEARRVFDQNDDRIGKDAAANKSLGELAGSEADAETGAAGIDGKKKKSKRRTELSTSENGAVKKRKCMTVKLEPTL
ncbi:hypothetical protein LOZ65_001733 [Ophidiomyces ophidiicola]|nr:hypothetical protein LOZ65_001733 [Ophidiomyces ophidiicola]